MNKLLQKSSKLHLVIEVNDKKNKRLLTYNDIENVCNSHAYSYWLIRHDNDLDDTGNLKHSHYHLILSLHSPKRLETVLIEFSNELKVEQKIISISKASDLMENIRYLMHLDNDNKTKYSINDVRTNDLNLLNEAYIYITSLSTSELINIVSNSNSMKELVYNIGLTNFKKYANVINMLWKEKYSNNTAEYLAIKKSREYLLNKTLDTLRKFGLDYKCDEFTDLIAKELIKEIYERGTNIVW